MPDQPLQNSLFEDDYLLRELGQVAHVPQVALTELVANAWDAGATRVDLILPGEIGGTLTVTFADGSQEVASIVGRVGLVRLDVAAQRRDFERSLVGDNGYGAVVDAGRMRAKAGIGGEAHDVSGESRRCDIDILDGAIDDRVAHSTADDAGFRAAGRKR